MDALLYTGAAFGAALGVSILPFRRRTASEKWLMGSLLILGAMAVASITLQHQLSRFDRGGLLELFEIGAGFAVGPLLYRLCTKRIGVPNELLPFIVHLTPAIFVSALIIVEGRFPLPISTMVLHQVAYTAAAARVTLFSRRRDERDVWSVRVVAMAASIHLAQFCRMAFTDVALIRNIVPATMVGGLSILAFLALRQLLEASLMRATHKRYERSGLDATHAESLRERLQRLLVDEKPWLDPHLSLDRLAALSETTPHHLSEVLNVHMNTGFNELIVARRLDESKLRLADPENDRFTIEAIAEASGFSSRSSFYAAFRRAFNETPTQFRSRIRPQNE